MSQKLMDWNNQLYRVELIIDEELSVFFSRCLYHAEQVSNMIAEDRRLLCDGIFEKKVISIDEIIGLISKINDRIYEETGMEQTDRENQNFSMGEYQALNRCTTLLMQKSKEYRLTQYTSHIAENAISNSFSYVLGKCSSSSLIDFASGYVGIGKWVLGKNHKSEITKRFQKSSYQYMKGALVNLKTTLKNEMVLEWERSIDIQNLLMAM